jgi:glyoxylase-like metal-dependent hydrolase (beta-lactamase superfamily II)
VPEHAAAYLLIEDEGAAFIDNNTAHALPYLLGALRDNGLGPDDLKYIIPTHLHMDHAGCTSALAASCPRATVLCHPRAVRHFVDPARLIAGSKAVYGDAEFARLYGEITPIDAARIRAVDDEETLTFGRRTLRFLHTRGHANHHICIYDSAANGVYTGDAFGVEYSRHRKSRRPFILCSTAPTEFDPVEARTSVHRILATGAERVFVAHYGELEDIRGGAKTILKSIDRMDKILHEAIDAPLSGEALQAYCESRVREEVERLAEACGAVIEDDAWPQFNTHIRIDAQGLALAAEKLRQA